MFGIDLNYVTGSDSRPDTGALIDVEQYDGDLSYSTQSATLSRINYRFAVIAFALALLLSLGVALLRDYQVNHLASGILAQARHEHHAGRLDSAAVQFHNYLQLVPDDASERLNYLTILQDCEMTSHHRDELYMGFRWILREKPHHRDIRRRLIDLLIQDERRDEASNHIEILLEDNPEDGALFVRLGQCHELTGRESKAVDAYSSAIRLMPRELYAYKRLLHLHLNSPGHEHRANAVQDRLLFNNPRSSEASLLLARLLRQRGRTDLAMVDARNAWLLAPDNPEVLEFVAGLIATSGDPDQRFDHREIRSRLESALKTAPDRKDLISATARLDFFMGRPDLAEQRLRDELETDPGSVELRWLYADFLISQRKLDQARKEVDHLHGLQEASTSVGYLDARIDIARNKLVAGVRKLESVREQTVEHPEMRGRIHLLLGKCYEKLGHAERQLASFRKAVSTDELSSEARIGLARSLHRLGQIDDALQHYRRKIDVPGVPIQVANLLVLRNMNLPPENRQWSEFERALDIEVRNPANIVDILLLRCRVQVLQGQLDDAREMLARACETNQGQVRLWVALAGVELRRGRTRDALAVLAAARQQFGNRVELLQARIRIAVTTETHKANLVLAQIENECLSLSDDSRRQVISSLANAWEQIDYWELAERTWRTVIELNPDDLTVIRKLLSLALRRNGNNDVQHWLEEIQRIEGPGGTHSRLGEAARYMMLARSRQPVDQGLIDRAQELLNQLDDEIPMSVDVSLLLADTHEMRGDTEAAIACYSEAIDRGKGSAVILQRVIRLLYSLRRFTIAARFIGDFGAGGAIKITSGLGRMISEVSIRTGKFKQAVELARIYVRPDSQDYRDYLWLGQILSASGQLNEAEESLQQAIDLDRTQPKSWIALVDLLGRHGRITDAEDAIAKMKVNLSTDEVSLALAQCYESMGKFDVATEHYEKALSIHLDNCGLMLRVARHYIQTGRFDKAEPVLRQLLDGDGRSVAVVQNARRLLAITLAATGKYPGFCEALELVNENIGAGIGSVADLRAKARLLASRPSHHPRREAIEIFESLDNRAPLSPQDQLQLIGLYEATGNRDRTILTLGRLIRKAGSDPDYLALAVRAMLHHGELDASAEAWLEKLEQLQPEEFRTLELRILVLIARNRVTDALNIVHRRIDQMNDDTERQTEFMHGITTVLGAVAVRFNESGRSVAAARITSDVVELYRRLLGRRPECTVEFVRFLGTQWRLDEAFELCETAWDISPPAIVAEACTDLLRTGRASHEQFQLAQRWLQKAIEADTTSPELAYQAASAAHLAGQYAEAEIFYRCVIQLAPESTIAINELALLLALHRGKPGEATQLINRAIEISGPLSFLLDTRAVVYISAGEAGKAIDDLEQAVSGGATADHYFHLAQAHVLTDHTVAARTAWDKSLSLGLHVKGIHPLERRVFGELELKLK